MIIRSQDKKMIINFNGSSNIYTQGTEIWANTYHGIAKLGKYSTEAKAIKALDMICEAYSRMEDVKCGAVTAMKYDSFCFQLPQDSEV